MSEVVLSTAYAPPISYIKEIANADKVWIESKENFQKQSYRNRCKIAGANGALNLIVPIQRKGERTLITEVAINQDENWQNLHWRSLEAAYRSSPYFEYYEHQLMSFYKNEFTNLFEFNTELLKKILSILQIDTTVELTSDYIKEYDSTKDLRNVIHPKKEPLFTQSYIQVFGDRYDFIPDLSIFDLLFNEGPNSVSYFA